MSSARPIASLLTLFVTLASFETPSYASIIQPSGAIDPGYGSLSIQSLPDVGSSAFRPRDSGLPDEPDSTTVLTWNVAPEEIAIQVGFELGPDLSEAGSLVARTRGLTFMVDVVSDYRLGGSLALANGNVRSLQWRALLAGRPTSSSDPLTTLFADSQLEEDVASWNTVPGQAGPGDGLRLHEGRTGSDDSLGPPIAPLPDPETTLCRIDGLPLEEATVRSARHSRRRGRLTG